MLKTNFNVLNENQSENIMRKNQENSKPSKKRLATSPAKGDIVKRSAFGDITNALNCAKNPGGYGKENAGKKIVKKTVVPTRKSLRVRKKQESKDVDNEEEKTLTEKIANVTLSLPNSQSSVVSLPNSQKSKEKSSLYTSDEDGHEFADALDSFSSSQTPKAFYEHELSPRRKEMFYEDLDAENINNPNEAPIYGLVIFEYMRAREHQFLIKNYLSTREEITADMRAILVDWMVEVQENFELNHETLYLAVKLVDLYLQKKDTTTRDMLQLIGATALLIAAKFDERHPPYIDDFLYICDDAYNKIQMLSMERSLLYAVGFDINIPISYRFLRRYAKCSKTNMQTLTLARFALELSLQCYDFVQKSDSLMAGAALWLSFKMNKNGGWTDTLVYYSSHTEYEVMLLARQLNSMIEESKGKKLQTVWQKYSHPIFYEVAKTQLLTEEQLKNEEERIRQKESLPKEQLVDDIKEEDKQSELLQL